MPGGAKRNHIVRIAGIGFMGIVSGYEPWNINKKFVRSRFACKFVYGHNKPSIKNLTNNLRKRKSERRNLN